VQTTISVERSEQFISLQTMRGLMGLGDQVLKFAWHRPRNLWRRAWNIRNGRSFPSVLPEEDSACCSDQVKRKQLAVPARVSL
jgi:hypothetical protein